MAFDNVCSKEKLKSSTMKGCSLSNQVVCSTVHVEGSQ